MLLPNPAVNGSAPQFSPSVRSWGLWIWGELTRYGDEGSGITPVKKIVVLEQGLNGK